MSDPYRGAAAFAVTARVADGEDLSGVKPLDIEVIEPAREFVGRIDRYRRSSERRLDGALSAAGWT